MVVFTTPNFEFNVLFGAPIFPNGFRHDDHKFEWTRLEFQEWAHNVCTQYPDYYVEFYGIGPGPPGSEHLGCCTQMAVFVRRDLLANINLEPHTIEQPESVVVTPKLPIEILDKEICPSKIKEMNYDDEKEEIVVVTENTEEPMDEELENEAGNLDEDTTGEDAPQFDIITLHNPHPEDNNNELADDDYKLIFTNTFPANRDNRSRDDKILHEAQYHINRFLRMEEEHYDNEEGNLKLPLKTLLIFMTQYIDNEEDLKRVLTLNKYQVDDNNILIVSNEFEREEEMDDVSEVAEGEDINTNEHYSTEEEW